MLKENHSKKHQQKHDWSQQAFPSLHSSGESVLHVRMARCLREKRAHRDLNSEVADSKQEEDKNSTAEVPRPEVFFRPRKQNRSSNYDQAERSSRDQGMGKAD